jgi:hypothetical protein
MKHAAISAALLGVLAAPAFAGDECRTLEDENAELRLMLNHVTTELLRKDAAAKHEVEFQLKRANMEYTLRKARLLSEYLKMCEKAKVACNAKDLWEAFP